MREIIRAIGFQPKDMSHADLEKVFTMFLSYQRTHRRRTVICIEQSQDSGCWMLDKIRKLVEMEAAGKYGLMIILSGQPGLNQCLGEPPLNAIRGQTRERIYLAPLSENECREYIQRRVEAGPVRDISQVFDFHAIARLHELSAGVPDTLSDLCTKCLALRDQQELPLVTPELVDAVGKEMNLTSRVLKIDLEADTGAAAADGPLHGRFVTRINEEIVLDTLMRRGHLLVGRDAMCDICINHPTVSRHHALIVNSPRGVKLVDLGSTNGTYVNSSKVRQVSLSDNDLLSVGAARISYSSAGSESGIAGTSADFFESHDAELDVLGTELLREIDSLGLSPANSPTRH
jgi:hypothetical protein